MSAKELLGLPRRLTTFIDGSDNDTNGLTAYLVRGAGGTFVLKLVSLGFGFVTNLLLARLLGAAQYGIYQYVFAFVGLFAVLSVFGLDQIAIREISAYRATKDWALLRGFVRFASTVTFLISVILAAGIVFFALIFRSSLNSNLFPALWIAPIVLPIATLSTVTSAYLLGLKRVILARIPGVLLKPVVFILAIIIIYYSRLKIGAGMAVAMQALALSFAVTATGVLLLRVLPREIGGVTAAFKARPWITAALPILLVAASHEISTRAPVLFLGSLSNTEEVGFFSVATLLAGLISFALLSVNLTLGPVISELYIDGNLQRLQRLITKSARFVAVAGLFIFLALVLLRKQVLLAFGPDFQEASIPLLILGLGQLVSSAAGSVGHILIMTGREKIVAKGMAFSVVINIALSLMLIPMYRAIGAALASVSGLLFWNLYLLIRLHSELGLDSTALGLFHRWRASS